MKNLQLNLFTITITAEQNDAMTRESWKICWNWSGPKIGGVCSFNNCLENDINGRVCYVMMAPARVLAVEKDIYHLQLLVPVPTTIAVEGEPLAGREFKIRAAQIWPYICGGEVIDDFDIFEKNRQNLSSQKLSK